MRGIIDHLHVRQEYEFTVLQCSTAVYLYPKALSVTIQDTVLLILLCRNKRTQLER